MKYFLKIINFTKVVYLSCMCISFIACKKEPKPQAATHEACVTFIFTQDSIHGNQRNHDSKKMSLSDAIEAYIENSKQLDFTNCKQPFETAFRNHVDAWQDFQNVARKHSNLRGELHEIFSKIEQTEDSVAFQNYLNRIIFTWNVVKTIAKSTSVPEEAMYFGQQPPGLTPKKFAPGIVCTDNLEIAGAFTRDMEAFYFIRQAKGERPAVRMIRYKNGAWQQPIVQKNMDGFFAADGNTFYSGNTFRERTENGWSEPKKLGMPYDTIPIMRFTMSDAQTYVFDERDTIGTIRYARLINGKRETPKPFGAHINTGKWVAHPFISPDESYIIWDAERAGGYGETDLYISFQREDGSYGKAINMGSEINTPYEDGGGSITPDGKYFMYNVINLEDREANIYWVDAKIIDELRKLQE